MNSIKHGDKFGKLTAIEELKERLNGSVMWLCECECGKTIKAKSSNLINGYTTSCGCSRGLYGKNNANYKHGQSRSRPYKLWKSIKSRCGKQKGYESIRLCEAWQDPKIFVDWCLKNGYQQGLQIDRINTLGNYEPTNCRFVTNHENSDNRKNTWVVLCGNAWLTVSECSNYFNSKGIDLTPAQLRQMIYKHQIVARRKYVPEEGKE